MLYRMSSYEVLPTTSPMPRISSGISGQVRDGISTPIRRLRPLGRPEAVRLGTNCCSSTIRNTRSRVVGSTSGLLLRTREIVAVETPANLAISRIVDLPGIIPPQNNPLDTLVKLRFIAFWWLLAFPCRTRLVLAYKQSTL